MAIYKNKDSTAVQYASSGNDANLATIEETTTASKAYAVGDFLVLNNRQLYKVTQAIASGGIITIGTNVVAAALGDEITEINSDLTELSGNVTTNTNNITTLTKRVSANVFGSAVNLASYTSTSNKYTFPKDGYLRLHCTSSGYVVAELNVTINVIARYNSCDYVTVPVRQGMTVYIKGSSGSFLAYYYPFSGI